MVEMAMKGAVLIIWASRASFVRCVAEFERPAGA
jgi:hypothetical protein